MLQFKEFTLDQKDILKEILQKESWPFHSGGNLTDEQFDRRIENNHYTKIGQKTFLILHENQTIGFVRIFDLGADTNDAETPLFDIRLKESERQKGFGKQSVNWLIQFVFENYPNKNRFEATTRQDNKAMRKVLEQCRFVKEAHYRQSWPTQDPNKKLAAIGYGLLRQDWKNKTTTPVNWDD